MKNVTKRQAETTLRKVNRFLDEHGEGEAKLYPPGFHANGWVIAYEGGSDWWVHHCLEFEPKGVFAEPINHWSIGLYPEA